jgi:hypothetical protein
VRGIAAVFYLKEGIIAACAHPQAILWMLVEEKTKSSLALLYERRGLNTKE